ncbi:MAG TPA: hypothetical protein VGE00_08220 [Gammaproteobacteria bacterium]
MNDNRYAVIFTGHLKPELSAETVTSNLVLDLGLAEQKVQQLLRMGRVVLKRCGTVVEAQRIAEKFDRSGIICIIEDRLTRDLATQPNSSGESSLIRLINKFIPSASRPAAARPTSRKV